MVEWESPTIHFHLVQFSFHFRQSPKIQFQENSPTLLLSIKKLKFHLREVWTILRKPAARFQPPKVWESVNSERKELWTIISMIVIDLRTLLKATCNRTQQLPTLLGPAVHSGNDTIHKTLYEDHVYCACVTPTLLEELCKRLQHCCATLRRSRNKRNVGSCWLQKFDRC